MSIADQIWDMKYRFKESDGTPIDQTVDDTWRRVARSLASVEKDPSAWEEQFYSALEDYKYLPAGRITAGAGTERSVTLFNCLSSGTQILTAEYGIVEIGEVAGQSVTLVDGNGQWVSAPIIAHGEQSTAAVRLKGGYNGKRTQMISATAGHRWLLADGTEKTTAELVAGDALMRVVRTNDLAAQNARDYFKGVQHGIVYGDGSVEPAGVFRIRLCGEKSELADYFADWVQTSPPSFGGEMLYRGSSDVDLKALPDESANPAYRQGFLRGWFAADGAVCKRDHRPMLTCGITESKWIMKYGALSGMEVMFSSKLSEMTNYGLRNKSLYNLSFNRCTMIPEDFIRPHHREHFGETPVYNWHVISVGEYAEPAPVFCPAVSTTASFQLANGIHTGNCFVMGTVPDSISGIFAMLKEAALTMQQGGGIGYDFSTIRPRGAEVKGVAADASGPLTFMDVWDAMCRTIMSAGSRRGAMMATMRCDHPDVEAFIEAKRDPRRFRMFNMSVLITDPFMVAVKADWPWDLVYDGKVYATVQARDLWKKIMRNTYDYAEPGVIFIDRINAANNLSYVETIAATNPCFAGNQTLWTDQGLKTFAELEGQRVSVLTENQVGKLVYRPMDVFKTAENQEILRVTLDDGTTIDCTHTHEFFDLQRNRVEARDLLPGQRLASVYRHNANSKGYKRLTNGIDNPLEHHVPFEIIPDGFHVHHKNEIKDDNRPQNLELILGSDHNSYHMQGDRNPSITHPENNKLIQMDHSGSNNGRYREDLDDDDLQEMRKQGMSYIAIAQAVGCSKYTVMKRLGYERPNHKVVSVEPLMERQDVFCGTVEETHRFFLGCERGGVLVSNCGEQPLPPYGACLLGSINLAKLVTDPFTKGAKMNPAALSRLVALAVRMMDNVIDVSKFPLPQQEREAKAKRRIGLGVTGLADALLMVGLRYGSDEAVEQTEAWMKAIARAAYLTSVDLAKEKGAFPLFDAEKYLASGNMLSMDDDVREAIRTHGIRNALLTSIAPTGTISLYAGNVSSGIEPVFAYEYTRKVLQKDGTRTEERVEDYAVQMWRKKYGDLALPDYFVNAQTLSPEAHVRMQAAVQKWVDSSISKTVNLPEDISFEDFEAVYMLAYESGCKGCTTYRPNEITGSVLSVDAPKVTPVVTPTLAARPDALDGATYKMKWPGDKDALYVTINNDAAGNPFELFLNTKNIDHHAWMAAMARTISAVFRRGGDVSFIAHELREVFDPKGGAWISGKYVPSMIAAIGDVILRHIGSESHAPTIEQEMGTSPTQAKCASCGEYAMKNEGGCETCTSCGHSKCG